jgi:hypothetical protein
VSIGKQLNLIKTDFKPYQSYNKNYSTNFKNTTNLQVNWCLMYYFYIGCEEWWISRPMSIYIFLRCHGIISRDWSYFFILFCTQQVRNAMTWLKYPDLVISLYLIYDYEVLWWKAALMVFNYFITLFFFFNVKLCLCDLNWS